MSEIPGLPERLLSLAEARQTHLAVGDMVLPLITGNDFNNLELEVCKQIDNRMSPLEWRYSANPLANNIRPHKFVGEIKDGYAYVIQADLGAVAKRLPAVPPSDIFDTEIGDEAETPLTLAVTSLIVGGDLYTSGKGILGTIARSVTYYQNAGHQTARNAVECILGDAEELQLLQPIVTQLTIDAVRAGRKQAQYAVSHPLSCGSRL